MISRQALRGLVLLMLASTGCHRAESAAPSPSATPAKADLEPAAEPPPPPTALCADPDCLPGFRADSIDGKPLASDALRDKAVLVMFWASWCEPCIADGPTIDRVYRDRRAGGFEIVAFSRDETDAPTLRRFRDHYRLGYPIALSTDAIFAAFGSPDEIPTFLIYGRDGRLRARFTGALPAGILEREISEALGESGAKSLRKSPAKVNSSTPSPGPPGPPTR